MKPIKIKSKEYTYPANGCCAFCKSKIRGTYILFGSGAFLMNRRTEVGTPDDRLDGFCNIFYHGGEGDQGQHPNIFIDMKIVETVKGGQFNLIFCTAKCLRKFMNAICDSLETKIKKEVKKSGKKRRL